RDPDRNPAVPVRGPRTYVPRIVLGQLQRSQRSDGAGGGGKDPPYREADLLRGDQREPRTTANRRHHWSRSDSVLMVARETRKRAPGAFRNSRSQALTNAGMPTRGSLRRPEQNPAPWFKGGVFRTSFPSYDFCESSSDASSAFPP